MSALLVCTFIRADLTQWHDMPNGKLMHESCIHQHDQPFEVLADDRVKLANGTIIEYGACPYEAKNRPGTIASAHAAQNAPLSYYSDWVAYAKNPHASGVGGMTSDWIVPEAPTSRGPAPPLIASSIYIFNGIEDGMGIRDNASVILQPVLQYGKSGCLLNPAKQHDWYLTSYLVTGAGRAHCGTNLGPLSPGEKVRGTMTLLGTADGDGSAQRAAPVGARARSDAARAEAAAADPADSAHIPLRMPLSRR